MDKLISGMLRDLAGGTLRLHTKKSTERPNYKNKIKQNLWAFFRALFSTHGKTEVRVWKRLLDK